jgi:hypothetical protein
MNPQSKQAKDIFVQLIGNVPTEEWEDRLAETCGGNQELLDRVRALLRRTSEHTCQHVQPLAHHAFSIAIR